MVLISVQSVENDNGYQFSNDFAESLIIDPNSKVSLVNISYERKAEYLITNGANTFQIKVGDSSNSLDTIEIPQGNYRADELADAVEGVLNRKYGMGGHAFNVKYASKDQRFSFQHLVRETELATAGIGDWDIGAGTQAPSVVLNKQSVHNPILDLSGITNGTAEYIDATSAMIATTEVPSIQYGGSIFEMRVNFTGNCPHEVGVKSGFGMALWSNSLVPNEPSTGVKRIDDDMTWCDIGINFLKLANGDNVIKIYEKGVNIWNTATAQHRAFTPADNDIYRIELSKDGNGHPTYWYKRNGQTSFSQFNMTGAIQSVHTSDWEDNGLLCMCYADTKGSNSDLSFDTFKYSVGGSNQLRPDEFQNNLINGHTLADSADKKGLSLVRSEYNAGAGDITDRGALSQVIQSDFASELTFKLKANVEGAEFNVAVLDSTAQNANRVAGAVIGSSDPLFGSTSLPAGTKNVAPNFNPAVASFQFDSYNRSIEIRQALNGMATYDEARNIFPNIVDVLDANPNGFSANTWADATDPRFFVKCVANDNSVVITCSPSDDPNRADEVLVYEFTNNHTDFTGLHTANISANGNNGDYAPSTFITLRTQGGNGVGAEFNAETDANGALDPATPIQLLNAGNGYTVGETYGLVVIANDGSIVPGGGGQITITATTLATDKFNEDNRTDGAGAGYRWYIANRGWVGGATQEQPKLEGIELSIEEPQTTIGTDYCEFKPNANNSLFGRMIGFNNFNYYLNNIPTTGNEPEPDASATKLDPSIMINVNNLPIKSYVGQKVSADALLGQVIGSKQGLTRLIGKVPRYHDDTGVSHSGMEGMFYYNYFPYSVPLRNATELVLNELDITITNPDGTLAKDITNTNILLSISNVESVGEGLTGGVIGRPIDAPMSYDRLDMTKGQLPPILEEEAPPAPDPKGQKGMATNSPFTTPI